MTISKTRNQSISLETLQESYAHEIYMRVKGNCCPCVCKELMQNIKYNFELHITICLIFRKREIKFNSITRKPKSATKNRMLMRFTCVLKVTVVHVCTKN